MLHSRSLKSSATPPRKTEILQNGCFLHKNALQAEGKRKEEGQEDSEEEQEPEDGRRGRRSRTTKVKERRRGRSGSVSIKK